MRHKKVKVCSRCGQPGELVTHRTICRLCNLERKRGVAARALSAEAAQHANRTKTAAYRQTAIGRARLLLFFATKRAGEADRECSLDVHDIAARIAAGKCEVTGLPFDLKPTGNKHRSNPWAPSLDRRDSFGGYTANNVQVVVAAYNYAKSEWSGDVLLRLARAIVDAALKSGV